MIKISRFMVVQRALELKKDEDGDNRNFMGCLTWVKRMMDRFMVRGSHSPMQWMLDLRTYGMKIHFNTTADGHVDWQGDTVLYRKAVLGRYLDGLEGQTYREGGGKM
jgi:hypothetical protein